MADWFASKPSPLPRAPLAIWYCGQLARLPGAARTVRFRAVSVHAVGVMERSNRAVQGRAIGRRNRKCTFAHIRYSLARGGLRAYEPNVRAPCIYAFRSLFSRTPRFEKTEVFPTEKLRMFQLADISPR